MNLRGRLVLFFLGVLGISTYAYPNSKQIKNISFELEGEDIVSSFMWLSENIRVQFPVSPVDFGFDSSDELNPVKASDKVWLNYLRERESFLERIESIKNQIEISVPSAYLQDEVLEKKWMDTVLGNDSRKWARSSFRLVPVEQSETEEFRINVCYDNFGLSTIYRDLCFPLGENSEYLSKAELIQILIKVRHVLQSLGENERSDKKMSAAFFFLSGVGLVSSPASALVAIGAGVISGPAILFVALVAVSVGSIYEYVQSDIKESKIERIDTKIKHAIDYLSKPMTTKGRSLVRIPLN